MDINKVQELQFELMKIATFNEFNGERVVEDLKKNRGLWLGAVMDRASVSLGRPEDMGEMIDLIKLRDIKEGYWNIDTLFIEPVKGKEDELKTLAETWGADEVDFIGSKEAQRMMGSWSGDDNEKALLRVWWD